jgi:hypothetical protein
LQQIFAGTKPKEIILLLLQLGSGLAGTSTAQPISESDENTQQISFLPKVMVRGEQHELQHFGSKDSDWVPDNRVKEGRQQLELELEDSDKNAGEPVYEASDLASMKPQLDIDAIFTKQLSITQFRQIIMTLKHERDELKLQRDESNLQRDESNLERDELKVERDELKVERDKLFNEKYVDALQLVNSPQPPVRYQMKRNGGTNSATAMMPEKVAVWPHFFEGQTMYSQSRQSHFKKQGLIRRPRTSACSTLEEEKEEEEEEEEAPVLVRAEANLQNLSENIIYPTLNRLTRMKDDNTRIWTSSKTMCDVNFSGTPDGVTVIWHKDQTTGKWTSGQPITSWENKPEIVLQVVTDSDIVGLYNSDKETNGRWFRVITQIAGNMVHMRAKTAVLSTGIHVNCFLLKPDGMLWISPKIPSNRAGVGSVWNTLDYLLNLPEARDGKLPHLKPVEITVKAASQDVLKPAAGGDSGPGSKPAPAKGKENRSNQTNGTQPEASGGTSIGLSRGLSERPLSGSGAQNVPSCPETSKAKSISSCCNLRYLSMMQEHPDRSTYRAQWRSTAMQAWEDVVVKWYLPESMAMYEIEVACYLRAASMQGSSIAVLLDHGMALHLPGERWPRVGLMVRWAGNSYDVLPPTALVLARQILEELHGLGVVHGDVKTHNMGYDPSTGRVFLFDFSEGRTLPMFKDEATFREACKEDLEMVDWDIEWATAHPQRWQCYI